MPGSIFTFKKRTAEDAHDIALWHYSSPYDFYDMDQDLDDLAEWLDLKSLQEPYYSVFNEENELVGFTSLNAFMQHTNGGEYEFLRMVRPQSRQS